MVYLLAGPKGTGKTQQMIEQANEAAKKCDWSSDVCSSDLTAIQQV